MLTDFLLFILQILLFSSLSVENSQRMMALTSHPKVLQCFTIFSVDPRKKMAAWESSTRDVFPSSVFFGST